jgi:hypothetical protein
LRESGTQQTSVQRPDDLEETEAVRASIEHLEARIESLESTLQELDGPSVESAHAPDEATGYDGRPTDDSRCPPARKPARSITGVDNGCV